MNRNFPWLPWSDQGGGGGSESQRKTCTVNGIILLTLYIELQGVKTPGRKEGSLECVRDRVDEIKP